MAGINPGCMGPACIIIRPVGLTLQLLSPEFVSLLLWKPVIVVLAAGFSPPSDGGTEDGPDGGDEPKMETTFFKALPIIAKKDVSPERNLSAPLSCEYDVG